MKRKRFIHLRDLVGYDNLHIAKMFLNSSKKALDLT